MSKPVGNREAMGEAADIWSNFPSSQICNFLIVSRLVPLQKGVCFMIPCPPRHCTRPRSIPHHHSSHPRLRHHKDHRPPRNRHHRSHPHHQGGYHQSSSV